MSKLAYKPSDGLPSTLAPLSRQQSSLDLGLLKPQEL